jgi:hypothetical protein
MMKIEITDCDSDDFTHCRTALIAKLPDGRSRRWTIPNRLVLREDVLTIALQELAAELDEATGPSLAQATR